MWVAAGKERARGFEQALLADGRAAEGYPAQGLLNDSLPADTGSLAHPLAALSPLTKAVPDAAAALESQSALEKGEMNWSSGEGGKGT
ncbi:hypothetical protein Rt10032_c16g5729 [Rhodotorula toruloides]|uniref:Uncharacterized protein n=1 Tax=Rhodotorula toruloides TaxID=5286 RepID=A0A511KMV3_RHOTO|nr:hypothetical protein Rt10032_c16g5729 [Rhodotorula toruloides]